MILLHSKDVGLWASPGWERDLGEVITEKGLRGAIPEAERMNHSALKKDVGSAHRKVH